MRTTSKGLTVWDQTTDPFSHAQLAANWDLVDRLLGAVPLKVILAYHADLQNETIPSGFAVCDGTTLDSSQQDIVPGSTYPLPDLRNRFLLGADITKIAGTAGGTTNFASDAPGPRGVGGSHAKTLSTSEIPSHTHTGTALSAGSHNHGGSVTTSSGGAHTHTGTINSSGNHTHTGSSVASAGAHTHTGSTALSDGLHAHTVTDPGHRHSLYNFFGGAFTNSGALMGANNQNTVLNTSTATTGVTIDNGGAHTHALSIASDGAHTHAVTVAADGTHSHTFTIDNTSGAHTHTFSITSDGAHTHTLSVDATGGGSSFDTRPRYYGVIYIMKVKN